MIFIFDNVGGYPSKLTLAISAVSMADARNYLSVRGGRHVRTAKPGEEVQATMGAVTEAMQAEYRKKLYELLGGK